MSTLGTGRDRRDPQPLGQGWELPVIAAGAIVIGAALAALAGMGAAAAVKGSGWVWPAGSHTMTSALAGLLAGHPGSGLPAAQAARLPASVWVYIAVGLAETLLLATVIAVAVIVYRRWRPGVGRGMATRAQAADALGIGQLRAARSIIRPDLHQRRKGGDPQ